LSRPCCHAMFDFGNLDGVDRNEETPEWVKWQGVKSVQRVAEASLAILEDEREEQFVGADDEYVFEKLEVPFLPEDGAFDPIGFYHDSTDVIEDKLALYNGQVVMNFVATAYEQHMFEEIEKADRKAHIEAIHNERRALLSSVDKNSASDLGAAGNKRFDQKSFGWRDLHSNYLGQVVGLPDGGVFAELVLGPTAKIFKPMLKIKGCAFMTTGILIQLVCSLGHLTRPNPSGPRITRNAPWHLALSDVFFPSPTICDDGSEYISKNEESPTFVHMVVISVNKETGEIEAKSLLENIKITGSTKYPKRQSGR